MRTIKNIVSEYVDFLNNEGMNLNKEEILYDEKLLYEVYGALLNKCYDEIDGFYYFVTFIVGKEQTTQQDIWNNFLEKLHHIVHNNPKVCVLAPRWHGKSFYASILYPIYLVFLFEKVEVLIVNNTSDQLKINFDKLKDIILDNEALSSKQPESGDKTWRESQITYNRGKIYTRSMGQVVRGVHCNIAILDDVLRDDQHYSSKYIIDYVKESLMPTVRRKKGRFIVIGTPQSQDDLFHYLMEDKKGKPIRKGGISRRGFYSRAFPAITNWKKKKVLCPDIVTFEELMEELESMGKISFDKEYMVRCISDKTAIFPEDQIQNCLNLGEDERFKYSSNDGSYVISADVATSGAVSADYSVFFILEVIEDDTGLIKIVRNIIREKGMSVNDQIETLKQLSEDYNGALVEVEKNNVGVALIQQLEQSGVNVKSFVTDSKKKTGGIRFLLREMKKNHIIFPCKGDAKEKLEPLLDELRSFGVRLRRGKESMEALKGHDDCVMSLMIGNLAAQEYTPCKPTVIIQD